jgi:hypothetical protein
MNLHGAIDDASGTVLALHFRPTEDLHGYATLLHELGTTYGLPLALYGDRLNVFVRNDRHWSLEEQLQGAQHPTHFGQMLRGLGIGYIAAGSPEAKGRVERLWRTLQDRLTVELRLRGITTLAAANAFLPTFRADFNRRFARPPAEAPPAWRPAPRDLAAALSCHYQRQVGRDNVVRLGGRLCELPPGPYGRSYARVRVELHECVDGRLLVLHQGRRLMVQPSPSSDFVLQPRQSPRASQTQRRGASRNAPAESAAIRLPSDTAESRTPQPTLPAAPAARRSRPADSHPWRHSTPYSRRSRQRTFAPA